MQNASNIYLSQEEEGKGLRAIQRKNINFKEADPLFQKILQCQKVIIVAAIECFDNINVLKPLDLPTKRSPLQIFLEKVQTVNTLNHCSLSVIFIVNPSFDKSFDEELNRILRIRDLESSRDTETSLFDFRFEKIIYVPQS